MSGSASLSARVVSASFWSIAAELIAGAARAISYVVFARILSPTDFGLVGFALLLLSLFPLLIDNSLTLALVRLEREDQRMFSAIFFLNVALSAVAVAVLCLVAIPAAGLLHDERVVAIVPVLSLQLLFNSLCAVHLAVARRRFEYRRMLPIKLISTAVSLAVGIPMALAGAGYWSLVFGAVAGSLAQMIAAWALLDWRPSRPFEWRAARSIWGFTGWVAFDMAVTWLVMSGGGFFLALFLGAHDLGLFRLSDQINTYLFGAVLNPLIPVLYSAYCEVSAEPHKSQPLFNSSTRAVGLVAMTAAGATVIVGRPLEHLIGPNWQGVGAIIILNAIADGISYAILPVPSFMRAQGRAQAVAYLRLGLVIGQALVYSFVAARGVVWFVVGKLVLELLMYLASYGVMHAVFAVPVLRTIGGHVRLAIIVAVCAAIGLLGTEVMTQSGPVLCLLAGLMAYVIPLVVFMFFSERQTVQGLMHSMRGR